ncbi:GDPD-domain-containing protein [Suhomyces tanzawaensis NRRL Y-17324]|uniref:GDPD-domain-containing protein n=1 Tax=Suhomyces tanzawaensis NRRL Y-17324 TaxID=984487 RepID=A0A1E4SGP3_9ASCO|nr:GDPD-domain-containing protein [Suhomyces tanzawaensis NRRL Y-17324]ODV78687.1 GDPD-domain-containing protein [Suhomyces tanzawaensis NRRL Y-17324]
MKFGKTLLNHQIPEWSIFYMNYKHLKKIIKTIDAVFDATIDTNASEVISSVLSTFFFELDRDIEKVNEFYNNKFKEYNRRLDRLIQVLGYSNSTINHQIESNEELDEIISILLELRSIFRNLKWFGELNHKGFVKILKKLDKKLKLTMTSLENVEDLANSEKFSFELSSNNKETYLSTRVEALPFSNGSELLASLDTINDILNKLSDEEDFTPGNDQTAKSFEFLKIGNRRRYSFDQEFLQHYYELIYQNQHETLLTELSNITDKSKLTLKFLISLLSKAAMVNSTDSIDVLFDYLTNYVHDNPIYEGNPLYDKSDISGRNFFHQYITSLGKNQLIKQQKVTPGESADMDRFFGNKNGPDGGNQISDNSINGLKHILEKLNDPQLRSVLVAHDNYNRTPLHYCAQYGLKDATRILLEVLIKWKLIDPKVSIDNVEVWGDQEGLTPLHLSIIGKHPKTTENLIVANNGNTLCCPQLLLLAVRLNNPLILNSLISQGNIDIDYTDLEHNNETALYIASKLMLYGLVEFLLENGANTELGENVFGWTPIFIAAAEGDKAVVKLLIEFGSKFDIFDYSGWLPMEHASLRGHLEVADLLLPKDVNLLLYDVNNPENNLPRTNGIPSPTTASGRPTVTPMDTSELINRSVSPDIESSIDRLPESTKKSVNQVYKQLKGNGSSSSIINRSKSPGARHRTRNVNPIKSFGHRYLNTEESLILITLGTTDLRDHSKPIDLNKITLAKTFFTELDTALSLKITCRDKSNNVPVEPPVIIDLPLEDQHGSATDPITFKLNNGLESDDVIITFDLIPTYQYTTKKEKILGRAIALLKDAYTRVGPNLRSLNNNITLPILDSTSLDILGSLRFEYLCVKSFNHSSMSIGRSDTYWKQLVSTRVIGHRGLGKNVSSRNSLQLGENTVESFIAAASLGASYVEFDVQLTKDFIPVVYHDFTVAESGVDIPMHALTVEQFLGLKDDEKQHKHSSHSHPQVTQDDDIVHKVNRPRSLSSFPSAPNFQNKSKSHTQFSSSLTSTAEDERIEREYKDQINKKMMLTKTWKSKGFKGNARGLSVASNFVTLKELFKKLPKSIGFNIELKYPMLDEAEEESMGEIAIDLNFYVDTILKVIYDENTAARDIIFSSFHPDICLLLSLKQPTIPILFLTEAGTAERADIRSSSLQNAIRFSKKWNLLGIVSAAETLVKTPRLTQVVKSSGLVCVTYGTENNDPELAKIQMKAGVDAVIADSVLAVREGLRKDQESLKEVEDSASE